MSFHILGGYSFFHRKVNSDSEDSGQMSGQENASRGQTPDTDK